MSNTTGILYLIPIPIAEDALNTLSPQITDCTAVLTHYFAENVRTARRFLRSLHPTLVIEQLQFSEIDKHSGPDLALCRQWLLAGLHVGIMSEAGCPAVADPGAELVAVAQSIGAEVVPLVGPNSIILALMASGLNGQSFCFNGYIPVKDPARSKKIKELEALSGRENQTQLFIETPYRNGPLLADVLKNCHPKTRLCIAQDITGPNAYIKTKSVEEWAKNIPQLAKAPAVFVLLAKPT